MTGNTLNGRSLPGAQVYRSSEKNKHLKYLSARKNRTVICHVVFPNLRVHCICTVIALHSIKPQNEKKVLFCLVLTSWLGTLVINLTVVTLLLTSLPNYCVSVDSGAISGGLEVENGVSLRRYDSGIGDDHTSTAASEADLSSSGVTHGPDAVSEALSTLSSEVRPSQPTDSKGKNVKDILRSLVSNPDDVTVDPSLLPPSFVGSVGDAAREQYSSFDR